MIAATAADLTPKGAAMPYAEPSGYDWTGFYLGGHIGYAWGNSNWFASTAVGQPIATGSLSLSQGVNFFDEGGSWFEGLQIGYNWMLPNRFVIGAEADATFPPVNRVAISKPNVRNAS